MNEKYICGGSKYTLEEKTRTITLPISLDDLPKEIHIKGHTLHVQVGEPLHVSLVYVGQLIEKYDVTIPDFLDKVIDDFCDFIKTYDIDIAHYKDEYRFVRKNDKITVVVMCEVSNHNEFFDLINKKYQLNMKYPVPHVTLYTLDGETGTSLRDADDIKKYTIPIENPIGRKL